MRRHVAFFSGGRRSVAVARRCLRSNLALPRFGRGTKSYPLAGRPPYRRLGLIVSGKQS